MTSLLKRVRISLLGALIVFPAFSAEKPQNIIMVVADGMGPNYVAAYRYYMDNPNTPMVETTVFDKYLVGSNSTYPHKVSGYVTDSAASATALATGVKTYNGAIGVDINKKPLESVLVAAKKQGKKTGIVVTSQINHATPASYMAHNEHRRNYNAIADQYIDNGINADVMLGGGWAYFIRDDRNLVAEFKAKGFQYIDAYEQLDSTNKTKPLLGLFADKGLPFAIDDNNPTRLAKLTGTALKHLKNDKGYFLLVEASQVDWAGHGNDIAAAMAEMHDLAKTIELLEGYVKQHPNTLVVLTADHETGGMSLARDGDYAWNPDQVKQVTASADKIADAFLSQRLSTDDITALFGSELTRDEIKLINRAQTMLSPTLKGQKRTRELSKTIKSIIDLRSNTGWTSSGHTAADVPVYAFGHSATQFAGAKDNTDMAKILFQLIRE
ncbi:alkaline phosphatase [Thalassotalea agarivorans]|uniref:Alkaline phosphatase n=1 Tax=Thalassotalea agarivorans TaxID=349064 RepID=A0A1I0DEI0_THASX|nr:alkaline phosphatase [Thalassotalea agarivorans]SET30442.1 alkaline phosphatase [Thalassotalea agarivorans]